MPAIHAPVLVLDVGRVCIALHLDSCARILGYLDAAALYAAHPQAAQLAHDLEIGACDDDAFIRNAATLLAKPETLVRKAWLANLGDELPGIADVVRRAVAADLKVVLMSDTSAMHANHFFPKLSFRHQLAGTVYSHEVGACKPDPPMYEAVEARFCDGRPPLLFADDKAANLATAADRGWGTHHVVDYNVTSLDQALSQRLAHH